MSRIANEQQSWTIPTRNATRFDRQDGDLLPLLEFVYTVSKFWYGLRYVLAHLLQAGRTYLLIASLRNNIANLPVISTINHRQNHPIPKATKGLFYIARLACQTKPEHIHRR